MLASGVAELTGQLINYIHACMYERVLIWPRGFCSMEPILERTHRYMPEGMIS